VLVLQVDSVMVFASLVGYLLSMVQFLKPIVIQYIFAKCLDCFVFLKYVIVVSK